MKLLAVVEFVKRTEGIIRTPGKCYKQKVETEENWSKKIIGEMKRHYLSKLDKNDSEI